MYRLILSIPALMILLIAGSLNAEIIEIGSIDTPGDANDVVVVGDIAYVADSQAGLRIINISNPEEPEEIGFFDSPGTALSVAISGNNAYLADGPGGLCVIDISDPENPDEIGAFRGQLIINDVCVSGGFAYLADLIVGLRVIDISDPENPEQVGVFQTPDVAQGVCVVGDYAYVADRRSGLFSINISNPEDPQEADSYNSPGEASDVFVVDELAYVADGESGIHILTVRDPNRIFRRGTYDTPGLATRVVVANNLAFVADGVSGMQLINVSDSREPNLAGVFNTPGNCYGVCSTESYTYVADGESGLRILSMTPNLVIEEEELNFGGVFLNDVEERTLAISNDGHADLTISNITLEGDYFSCNFEEEFVISGNSDAEIEVIFTPEIIGRREGMLTIFSNDPDMDELDVPLMGYGMGGVREVGFIATRDRSLGVVVRDDFAFIADCNAGLRVVDISQPGQPEEVGICRTQGSGLGIDINGDFAYVACTVEGLGIFDISNPERPLDVSLTNTPGNAYNVSVRGIYAFVADWDGGLRVIDVEDPDNPREVGFYVTPSRAQDVAIQGNFAYVANWNSGLRVIDISDPERPDEVGFLDTPGTAHGIFVAEDIAYIADCAGGLRIINIADPEQPEEIGFFDTQNEARDVFVNGDVAFVADWECGLRVIDVSNPEDPSEVGFCDTPGNAYSLTVIDNLAYVADWAGGVRIIDISDFVTPVPIISVDQNAIEFGGVETGGWDELVLTVSNIGNADLTILEMVVEGAVFRIDFMEEVVIGVDEVCEVAVRFSPEEVGEYEGLITILSDDLENEEIAVRLTGTGIAIMTVPLTENWNLISINVYPSMQYYRDGEERGPDVIRMMEQLRVDEDNHHVLLMKNEDGRFYLPAFDFNNIPYWDLTEGYQIKVDENIEVSWAGNRIPADADIPLERDWNLVAYFPTYELDASAPDYYVLSPIIDNVVMAKDNNARFLLPAFGFSNMPPWRETMGYLIKTDEEIILNYPPMQDGDLVAMNTGQKKTLPVESSIKQLHFVRRGVSFDNMSLLISGCEQGQIGALSTDGSIVGSEIIGEDGRCGLAIWGDDESTIEKEGLSEGESFELVYWDSIENREIDLEVGTIHAGEGLVYKTNSYTVLDVAKNAEIPQDYYLDQNHPNPFNNVTQIKYGLPETGHISLKIYDNSGRFVCTLINRQVTAGHHAIEWNAKGMPSGLYVAQLKCLDRVKSLKMILLK